MLIKHQATPGFRRLIAVLYALLFFSISPPSARAGYLTISGQGTFEFTVEEEVVRLKGEYSISNSGNEAAHAVYPHFTLGAWQWVGEERQLKMGESTTWLIEEQFPVSKLLCREDPSCRTLDLPTRGRFPLRIVRHYQDINGYSFSAAEALPVLIGPLSKEDRILIQLKKIKAKLLIEGDGQEFEALFEVYNSYSEDKDLAIFLLTSQEIESPPAAERVSVPAGGSIRVRMKLKNFSGIIGSNYNVQTLLQWEDDGIRNTHTFGKGLQLLKQSNRNFFVFALVGGVLLLAALFYFFVLRFRSKTSEN